ncbi:hypothetical protein RI367_001838 [Sorochytrium milnesiophthora]
MLPLDYGHFLAKVMARPDANLAIAAVIASCAHQALSTVLFQNGSLAKLLLERPLRRGRWRGRLAFSHTVAAWLYLRAARYESKPRKASISSTGPSVQELALLSWKVRRLVPLFALLVALSELLHLCHLALAANDPYRHAFIGALRGQDVDISKVESVQDDTCAICVGLPEDDVMYSPEYVLESFCSSGKHLLHRACVKKYLDTAMDFRCPICRDPLLLRTNERTAMLRDSLLTVLSCRRLYAVWHRYYKPALLIRRQAIFSAAAAVIGVQLCLQDRRARAVS